MGRCGRFFFFFDYFSEYGTTTIYLYKYNIVTFENSNRENVRLHVRRADQMVLKTVEIRGEYGAFFPVYISNFRDCDSLVEFRAKGPNYRGRPEGKNYGKSEKSEKCQNFSCWMSSYLWNWLNRKPCTCLSNILVTSNIFNRKISYG